MINLCWKPERVRDVINIDADFVPDSVFWAVDNEVPLTFREGEAEATLSLTTDELVERFLDPARGHYQLAVLGPAGTGKSHFIHRIRQRVQDRPGLEILAVRRLETNLRAILEQLIARLPGQQRERYRAELEKAGPALSTPEVQKSTLLDSLAQALEEDIRRPDSGIDPELENALLASLPNMLRDPYLRSEKFLKQGEVVPELVDRLFSNREGKRLEDRVLFERSNLPLEGITLQNCALQAREAIEIFLYNSDRYVPATLDVINRNLDRAIARALNFSGDQLGNLMGEIRAYLKAQGKELVILFEEFARLQGYDAAMLSALLVQGGDKLCNVRWALACTTGRFRELPDTVRTRMDGIVDMEGAPPKHSITAFAGRYLNAVRLGREGLERAFTDARERGVPSACNTCSVRNTCMEAFGTTPEGYSLYPFTEAALNTMALRINPEAETRFNPRSFQKNVLRPVLVDEAPALVAGEFPTASLLARMGGSKLPVAERDRLTEKAGRQFERYLSLLQLWSNGSLQNPPESVMRRFGLEPLQGLDTYASKGKKGDGTNKPDPPYPPTRSERDPVSVKLTAWVEGGHLDQTLAQRLRQALFPLIERAIDWDALGLRPTTFSGATSSPARPFRNVSIAFVRQVTMGGPVPPVRLELPLQLDDQGFTRAAVAFEALLKIEKTGEWGAGHGLAGLAALSELVEACAAEVVRQIEGLRGSPKKWDPIAGAVELLLVGSALSGALLPSQANTDEGLLEALFKEMPQDTPSTARELREVYDSLRQKRTALQDLLRAHITVAKGGHAGRFINPIVPLAAARHLRRRKWKLERCPDTLSDPYRSVGDLYLTVQSQLPTALSTERAERASWVSEVEHALGSKPDKQSVLEAVRQALDAAAQGGLPGPRAHLEEARDRFAGVQFAAALDASRRIKDADPPESELPSFGRAHRNAVDATRDLIQRWDRFLANVEGEVKVRRADHASIEVERETVRLRSALAGLIQEMSDLQAMEASRELA